MNKKTFYITTPIYYPSGNLHIGHVFTTSLASVIGNYKKLQNYDVKLLTGSDEHGQKIEKKAQELKIDPQKYVDQMSLKFKDLWDKLQIKYDYFSRTTSKTHEKIVQNIFTKLLEREIIYKGFYQGLYSIEDEEFFTKKQAIKKGDKYFHPISNHELKEVQEESYFFKMSLYEKWLKKYIKENKTFIFPKKTVNELFSSFLERGLQDLSISRTSFNWGVKIKQDPKHVIYVWLDALSNYITALNYGLENQDQDFQKYWQNGNEIVHIVGKEITRFHCIYWPIILKSLDLKMPTKIISHGWIMTLEGKMSKSKGNVVDPLKLLEKFHFEEIKYFFTSQINIKEDGVFDHELLKNIINTNLNNIFGNLLSRTVAMINQNFGDSVKYIKDKLDKIDKNILQEISKAKKTYEKHFDIFEVAEALKIPIVLAKKLNNYIDQTKPWTLTNQKNRLEVVLNTLLQGIYACCVFLSVALEQKMQLAIQQIGKLKLALNQIENFDKFDNVKIEKGKNIFKRYV